MISATLVLNVAYAVLVSSTMTRRILWLRGALVVAGVLFVVYGFMTDNWTMVFWNSVTSVLHGAQGILFIQSRRQVSLSSDDEEFRAMYFANLDPFDFHSLWTMGESVTYVAVLRPRPCCRSDQFLFGSGIKAGCTRSTISTPQPRPRYARRSRRTWRKSSRSVRADFPAVHSLRPDIYLDATVGE